MRRVCVCLILLKDLEFGVERTSCDDFKSMEFQTLGRWRVRQCGTVNKVGSAVCKQCGPLESDSYVSPVSLVSPWKIRMLLIRFKDLVGSHSGLYENMKSRN